MEKDHDNSSLLSIDLQCLDIKQSITTSSEDHQKKQKIIDLLWDLQDEGVAQKVIDRVLADSGIGIYQGRKR